ncbi:unnamed protein product [Laminaria digitata]
MAFSNGGLWVSTFDESGRRCWVNDHTGERTYQFIRGLPVNPTRYTPPPAFNTSTNMMPPPSLSPWGYGTPSSAPSPGYGMPMSPAPSSGYGMPMSPAPSPGYGMSMGAYEAGYGMGSPPVTQAGNGGLMQKLQQFYIRPSSDKSWMWR